ncbi:SpoIIE family protein phosphatase [Candidatus Micrarchaeota archaeon]|nr:SpoIIE family protein phosphatase [Candidatus Micrarchaeota archaeon]
MPLSDFDRGRLHQFEKGKTARRIRSNFERLSRFEAHATGEREERERFIQKYDGLLNLNDRQIEILNGLSLPELKALDLIPPRFRKPFITQLPVLVQRDLERWKKQESPVLHNDHVRLDFTLKKGGGDEIPSTGGDSSDLLGIDDRHGLFTMLDFEGKGASANEPRGMVQGLLRGHVNSVRWVANGVRKLTGNRVNLLNLLPQKTLHRLLLFMLNSTERTHDLHFPDVSCYGTAGLFQVDPKRKQVTLHYVHLGGEPLFVLRKQGDGSFKVEAHGVAGPVPENPETEVEGWDEGIGERPFGNELYRSTMGGVFESYATTSDFLKKLDVYRKKHPNLNPPKMTAKSAQKLFELQDGQMMQLNSNYAVKYEKNRFHMLSAEGSPFTKVNTLKLGVGDKVVSFTDGLTEAMSHDGEPFGHHRILSILRENGHLNAEELSGVLKTAREEHIGSNIQENGYTPDDMRIRVFEVAENTSVPRPRVPFGERWQRFKDRVMQSWKRSRAA